MGSLQVGRMTVGIALMLLISSIASAQSVIAGLVTDNTGAVLPGVTVEAESPALIEKVRSATTDGQGRYSIPDLRPGLYSVTFTLTGFNGVRHDGISVASDVNVPINAELKIGGLEETITVSGETPVVDVQSTARRQIVDRALLDALPNTGNTAQIGALVPGVRLDVTNATGTTRVNQVYASVHGLTALKETLWLVDGLPASSMQANGQVNIFLNEAMNQEVTYQTSGVSAEASGGGLRMNIIPREGGNRFTGGAYLQYGPASWVSNNISQELEAAGLSAGTSKGRAHDSNVALGGPIRRDRLWFFGAYRQFGEIALLGDTFDDRSLDASNWWKPNPNLPQAIDDSTVYSASGRLTAQLDQHNKLTVYYDRPFRRSTSTNPASPAYAPSQTVYYTAQAKWTSTVTSHLFAEAGFARTNYTRTQDYADPALRPEPNTTEWYANAPHIDLVTDRYWKETSQLEGRRGVFPVRNVVAGSASYVTGSHTAKVGIQFTNGYYGETRSFNGDLVQRYRSGVADSVTVYNTPVTYFNSVSGDLGLFAQDSWTVRRLSVNGGVRYDRFASQIDSTSVAAGRFTPFPREQPELKMPTWSNVSPRIGGTYDLFGNARTAIKGSFGRYVEQWGTGFAQTYNSVNVASENRTWDDLNGDDIAQDNEIGPPINNNFGSVVAPNRTVDPRIARGFNLETTAGVQHQLRAGLGVTFMWFHRTLHNLARTDNILVTLSDYQPVSVVSPLDGSVFTVYNLDRAKLGQVQYVDTNSTDASRRSSTYDGFELSATGRLPGGAVLFGGWTTDRVVDVACDTRDNPNILRFCDQSELGIPFRDEFKLSASQPVGLGLQLGGTITSYAGGPSGIRAYQSSNPSAGPRWDGLATNWSISRTTRYAADCTGPCTPGALVVPNMTQTTIVVPLTPPGSTYQGRFTQINLQATRTFKFGPREITTNLQFYNALNTSAILAQNQTWGANLGRPSRTAEPRVIQVSARLRF